jgi:uncharacterized protein YbjT (DUF2867 family)
MKTFVTGGTSSIGKILIKEMSRQGDPARVLVRSTSRGDSLDLPGVEFVTGDVTDAESVRQGMQGCTRVTHMAAVVGGNTQCAAGWPPMKK